MRARAFSLRGVQELSLVSVLRTMLLAEAEEDEDEGGEGEVGLGVCMRVVLLSLVINRASSGGRPVVAVAD